MEETGYDIRWEQSGNLEDEISSDKYCDCPRPSKISGTIEM